MRLLKLVTILMGIIGLGSPLVQRRNKNILEEKPIVKEQELILTKVLQPNNVQVRQYKLIPTKRVVNINTYFLNKNMHELDLSYVLKPPKNNEQVLLKIMAFEESSAALYSTIFCCKNKVLKDFTS